MIPCLFPHLFWEQRTLARQYALCAHSTYTPSTFIHFITISHIFPLECSLFSCNSDVYSLFLLFERNQVSQKTKVKLEFCFISVGNTGTKELFDPSQWLCSLLCFWLWTIVTSLVLCSRAWHRGLPTAMATWILLHQNVAGSFLFPGRDLDSYQGWTQGCFQSHIPATAWAGSQVKIACRRWHGSTWNDQIKCIFKLYLIGLPI